MSKKWEIEGINLQRSFCDSGRLILDLRIKYLLDAIRKFFENETEENLHDIRIALRRVRYNAELFSSCLDKKKFMVFYKRIEFLQDVSGNVRDLDVFLQNLSLMKEKKIKITNVVFKKIREQRDNLRENLKLELMKFLHSKALNNFSKLLS